MTTLAAFLLLVLAVTSCAFAKEQVFRCSYDKEYSPAYVSKIALDSDLDVWSHQAARGNDSNPFIDIRVKNEAEKRDLLKDMAFIDAECKLWIENPDELALQDMSAMRLGASYMERIRMYSSGIDGFFGTFRSYDEINDKMAEWVETYPELARMVSLNGRTHENRSINALILTSVANSHKNKPVIYFNGGIHAREWISTSTVMFVLYQFLNTYKTDNMTAFILDNMQIVATPLSNPDGYEFSRTPGNRWWRKNRRHNADGSYGVDLNRNWDEHWGQRGCSKNPHSETYPGTHAFSEPETTMISNFVNSLPNKLGGIDFHSYGELVLRNWGWTTMDSKNEGALKSIGSSIVEAIKQTSLKFKKSSSSLARAKHSKKDKKHGTVYQNIKGADLYPASGATDDWMSVKQGMVSYTIELSPSSGNEGFAISRSAIVPVGTEIFKAMQSFCAIVDSMRLPPNQYLHQEEFEYDAEDEYSDTTYEDSLSGSLWERMLYSLSIYE